ncbi:DUF6912 family protein [Neoactinobaculum massilliense]|uniref:DUF6912 family protein n=1 Tax=Neoactinobaculum massilliense TaxID=2364794 RepID=UPI000F52B83A|nr:hypothetical protein [Neoactinobaculum massilliense]
MRIYIPATARDLVAATLSPRLVHAVTPVLARELDGESQEYLESVAFDAATDDSLELIAAALPEDAGLPVRRVVIAADVDDAAVAAADDELVTAVELREAVGWDRVVSIHVDHELSEPVLRTAIAHPDSAEAADAAGEAKLLWFDVSERVDLAVELGVAARA